MDTKIFKWKDKNFDTIKTSYFQGEVKFGVLSSIGKISYYYSTATSSSILLPEIQETIIKTGPAYLDFLSAKYLSAYHQPTTALATTHCSLLEWKLL